MASSPQADPNDVLSGVPDELIAATLATLRAKGGLSARPSYIRAALEIAIIGDVCPATMRATASALGVPVDFVRIVVDGDITERAKADPTGQLRPPPPLEHNGQLSTSLYHWLRKMAARPVAVTDGGEARPPEGLANSPDDPRGGFTSAPTPPTQS